MMDKISKLASEVNNAASILRVAKLKRDAAKAAHDTALSEYETARRSLDLAQRKLAIAAEGFDPDDPSAHVDRAIAL